jgi:glycine oxidase
VERKEYTTSPPRLINVVDRVLVVGGGVIGLSSAYKLAQAGHGVTLVSPAPGRDGASWVAAGMLAPVTEAQFGEAALTSLLLAGVALWKAFATALEHDSGLDIGFDQSGTLTVAVDASDRAALDDLLAYQHELGCVAHRRSATQCRALVPSLTPALRGGIDVPGDHQVDNRALLGALVVACHRAGVEMIEDSVAALGPGPSVSLQGGATVSGDRVLLAAGVATAAIGGLTGAGLPPIRPVKGHIVRLGATGPGPALSRTVRALVHGRSIYLVPRRDGSMVVGATMEEKGMDTAVQAGAVHQLLDDARTVVPGIDELVLLEAQAGLRPAAPDNAPIVGWTELPGVAVATGHYRNGILLAPFTASAVVDLLAGS